MFSVYDSSAKLPSGLLNGNVNQYGDIDQCLNISSPLQDWNVKGRYCLTTMALRLSDPNRSELQQIHKLLMSYGMFLSNLDDVSIVLHLTCQILQHISYHILDYNFQPEK